MTAHPTAAGDGVARCRTPAPARGVALLLALVAVAVLSLASLVPLRNEQQAMWHERERELLFIGDQFRQALASYAAATPAGASRAPKALDELLLDKRYPNPRRHLRRVYTDPMTGHADWTLVLQQGGIVGVASTSLRAPHKRSGFARADAAFAQAQSYAGWVFTVPESATASAAAAVPVVPAPPTGGDGSEPAPTPAPAPNPSTNTNPALEAKRACVATYLAAREACARDQANASACNAEAALAYRACLAG